jgi:Cytochrome c554 and c-prime
MLLLAVAGQGLAAADLKCVTCHPEQAKAQPKTAMAQALQLADRNEVLKQHPSLTATKGAFTYRIETRAGASTYSVSDATGNVTVPIHYSFGAHSQTYVLEYQGHFYEGLVSYFAGINGLDTTIGDDEIKPQTLLQALGRDVSKEEAADCFGCHSTGGVVDKVLSLNALRPGVTCDHCHTGALLHQQAALKGKRDSLPPDLKNSTPYQISEFCGQCHRTWETIMRTPIRGTLDVRFQPYRLANSKCFDGGDPRLSCITCHDPHQELLPEVSLVDGKCLACHTSKPASMPAKACPVATSNCASCHMPKIPLPGGHRLFTDHQIRVVKDGDPYPN